MNEEPRDQDFAIEISDVFAGLLWYKLISFLYSPGSLAFWQVTQTYLMGGCEKQTLKASLKNFANIQKLYKCERTRTVGTYKLYLIRQKVFVCFCHAFYVFYINKPNNTELVLPI